VPDDLEITNFYFHYQNLLIYCTAPLPKRWMILTSELEEQEYYADVSFDGYINQQGDYVATVTCYAKTVD
jgi:hypothetical protein